MNVNFLENFLSVKIKTDLKKFSEISTDTRTIKKGALFIGLNGPNFKGGKYTEEALRKGALACIVEKTSFDESKRVSDENKNIFYVDSALLFLKKFAKAWIKHLDPYVISITGSNGKTTTKFFTAQMLAHFVSLHYSPKSFNNEIGVPLTQLGLEKENKVLICELGTSAPGEIESLSRQTDANLSVVTTVGPAHLDKLKNLEGVFNEKKQIYNFSKKESAVFNLDNSHTYKMYEEFKKTFKKVWTVSAKNPKADVFVDLKEESFKGLKLDVSLNQKKFNVSVPVFGAYNVYNIMFALAAGLDLKISEEELIEALKKLKTPWGRSQILKDNSSKRTYIFDGYNSNLQSMTSLLESLKTVDSSSLHVIVGEMLELGASSKEQHKKLGQCVGALNPKSVVFLGASGVSFNEGLELEKYKKKSIISDTYNKKLALDVKSMLHDQDVVVLKASRGTQIERFLVDLGVEVERL
jgi:UDP-N-acetylmuramoyl-tripeptide--D-alanyl-D-alanine ligase